MAALDEFLEPYDPAVAELFFATRKVVLAAAADANELIYDGFNAVSVAFTFTERLKEAFCHVAAYRRHVNLGFNRGALLPDPEQLLVGTGRTIRHVRIDRVEDLQCQGLQTLVRLAVEEGLARSGGVPENPQSIVKAVNAKKRRP